MAIEETARTAQLDAIFDFPLYYALTDTLCEGQPMGRLASTLSLDRVQTSGVERITFLDNHDLPRIASACGATPGRTRLALHLLFSLRGTPSLTYGTEAGLEGAEEPENRGDMPWDREMPLTEEIRQLWTFRNQGPNRTRDRVLFLDDETLFLLREGNDHSLLVLLHLGTEPRSLPWPEAFAGTEILASARLVDDEFTVSGPTSESPTSLTVGPGSLHRWIVPNTAPTPETTHAFAFEIFTEDERPLCEGSTIYVTGAGPELGNWDVSEALALEPMNPTAWTGSLEMAEGQVVAWHLLLNRDGEWIWADGPDRFGWVGDPEHDQGLVEGRILHLESTMLGIPSGDCPED